MSDMRQKIQLRLAFSEENGSEAPKAPDGGTETSTAKRISESPANSEQLMEEDLRTGELFAGLKASEVQQG